MALPIRLVVQFTPFPPGFQGDLNKFCRAFVDRIEVLSPFAGLTWQIGGIMPTSNVGPWLNDLGQPFVWNETLKTYMPMDLSLSLATVEADVAGALASIAAFTALVGSYSTTAQMMAAIAASGGGAAYPAAATITNQTVDVLGMTDPGLALMLTQKYIDPNNAFDNTTSKYTVPVSGYYRISAYAQTDNGTATPTDVTVGIRIDRNDVYGLASAAKSPTGGMMFPQVNGVLDLNAGDVIAAKMQADNGINTGNIIVLDFNWSIEMVQKK